jgi:hypothetical protein
VGDLVHISKFRGVFGKKYEQAYRDEVFTITECLTTHTPVYKLTDYHGEFIEGSFYEKELKKVQLGKDKVFSRGGDSRSKERKG